MNITELTLDQLTAIAGGVQMAPDGSTCTDRHIRKTIKTSKRMQKYTNGTSHEGMLVAKVLDGSYQC